MIQSTIEANQALNDVQRLIRPCIQCGTCTGSCPNALEMDLTPRKMWRLVLFDRFEEVMASLGEAAARAAAAGISTRKIWVDPGIGFGKNLDHNLQLIANLDRFAELGYPVVLGASRKSFIGRLTHDAGEDRLPGSLAAAGAATTLPQAVVRVHDVAATRQYLLVRRSIERGQPVEWPRPDATSSRAAED